MDIPEFLRSVGLSDDPLREIENEPDANDGYKKRLKSILSDLASGTIDPDVAKRRIRELNSEDADTGEILETE